MGLILEAMAVSGRTLSGLIGDLPRYHIIKHAVETPATAAYGALGRLEAGMRRLFAGAAVDDTDGLRFDWPDGWVHVRLSRTEQKLRVFSEADSPALAEHRLDRTLALLDSPET
jgi:phosphomannomutase